MKIAVISPNSAHLEDIGRYLQTQDGSRAVALHEGGMSKVRVVADQQRPDLIILDSMCRDLDELSDLEYVSTHHPHTVLVMLCANQSPDFLINAMRAGVREVLTSPVNKETLLKAVERIEQKLGLGAKQKQPGQILAFVPCKGGSGATFLGSNLGYQLAGEGKKVLLIDFNLQFGDAVLFVHDRKPSTNLADVARNIHRLDASFLTGSVVNVSPNFGVLASPEDPGQAMEVKPEHVDVLLDLAVNNYDFVVLDIGRNLDAVSIKALDRAHQIYPIVQLTLPFVRDASRLFGAFRSLGYSKEKIRLIVNRYEKNSEIKLEDVERSLGVSTFKTMPNSYEAVAASVNHGKPIASFARNNPVAKSLQEFAHALAKQPGEGQGWLGRLMRRG
jgi:pilus assembly protein CpaE